MEEKYSVDLENQESKLSKKRNRFEHIVPDVLDVAFATLTNPISGFSLIFKKIAEKASLDANLQKDAEADFQEKIKSIKDDSPSVITSSNVTKTTNYLTDEINKLAESAIRINDKVLMDQVFVFYRSAQKKLLASSKKRPLTTDQLAGIKTELGLIRLKVMWADSQKFAALAQKFREEEFIQEQARKLDIKEKALQIRVLLLFIFSIAGISYAIIAGSKVWADNTIIPWLGIPVSIGFWSIIGSLTNMLYKYYKKSDTINIDRELRWVWARPLVGVIMGAVTYLVAKSGLILIGAATPQGVDIQLKPEILWLFAFVGGFSDKIFEGVVEKVGAIATSEKLDDEKYKSLLELLSDQKISELSNTKNKE